MVQARFRPLAVVLAILVGACVALAGETAPPKPCSEPEQKQLDFWVGEWELSWPGNSAGETAHEQRAGHSGRVHRRGEFLRRRCHAPQGKSVSVFDAAARRWKQTWVDNEGGYLDLAGEFKDGRMMLAREATRPDGSKAQQRMVFKNITPDRFDWSWESSKDGGKTWTVFWPIDYKRRL